ncbi:site-specific DNA-methyltransferase (cytosine-N(4)-specific) OS=Lysinibacillus sphaericus OX=1421 GN=LS41612_06985 PE=3 SV=1 [Lysinibacillus sphaericus]
MIKDLETYYTNILNYGYSYPSLYEGDSKQMIFSDCTADNIITSPPYLTRIDYAVSTKPELLFLGYKQDTDFDE